MKDDTNDDAEIKWPLAIATSVRMPPVDSLVFAWKPLINGWDIVPGRQVREMSRPIHALAADDAAAGLAVVTSHRRSHSLRKAG